MAKNVNGKAFNTPVGRASYPHVFEKSKGMDGKEGKFELTLLIPKTTDISGLRAAIDAVGKEAFGARYKSIEALKNPTIRDGDAIADDKKAEGKDAESFRNSWVIRPKTNTMPRVVAPDMTLITPDKADLFYGGCYARCNVTPGSYNNNGNWGITLYLNAVQKVKDGERFGGSGPVDPFAVFEAIPDEQTYAAIGDNF